MIGYELAWGQAFLTSVIAVVYTHLCYTLIGKKQILRENHFQLFSIRAFTLNSAQGVATLLSAETFLCFMFPGTSVPLLYKTHNGDLKNTFPMSYDEGCIK